MKHKITIYTDSIFNDDTHETITDAMKIAQTIEKTISHLGKFDIYVEPIPVTWWGKLQRAMG